MNDTHHPIEEEKNGLAWGVGLIIAGLVLTVIQLDLFRADVERLWPLIPMAVGVVIAFSGRENATHHGLVVLGIGGWLLVSSLEVAGFHWGNSWPLIPIVVGVVKLVAPERGEGRAGGIMPIAIGGWLLINTRELWGLDWGDSWPLLLVLVGVGLVVKALVAVATERPAGGES